MNATDSSTPSFSLAIGLMRTHHEQPLDVYYPLILKTTPETNSVIALILETFRTALETSHHTDTKDTHTLTTTGFRAIYATTLEALMNTLNPQLPTLPAATQSVIAGILTSFQLLLPLLRKAESVSPASSSYSQQSWILSILASPKKPPQSVPDIYQRLMLISTRQVQPHELSLDGVFGMLPNIAWTNRGPILAEDIEAFRLAHALDTEPLIISHVDKFPYLINYHIPSGVRIADGSRVRLGAYLGAGSTVMPAGYVNFNAGTKGKAMIEGRISAGVLVGTASDLGGGASIMGTLSGGGKEVISIAAKCLIGANAGTGISLGFGSTIAAGVYVTAGSKVHLYDAEHHPISLSGNRVTEGANVVKATQLSGREKLLFYNDSQSGKLICKPNPKTIELNPTLHKN